MHALFCCALLLSGTYYVVAQIDYESDYGPEALRRQEALRLKDNPNASPEMDPNKCQNFGNVGQCQLICSYITDSMTNTMDDTVQFTVDISNLNVTSSDSAYTTCDPISGDILQYTSGKIITNVGELKPSAVAKFAPFIPLNTTCADWGEVELCMTLCNFIQDTFTWKDKEFFVVNLKAYMIYSNDGDTTLCDPFTGNIYDHGFPKQLLASFRELDIKPQNRTKDADGNRLPLWANADRIGKVVQGRRLLAVNL